MHVTAQYFNRCRWNAILIIAFTSIVAWVCPSAMAQSPSQNTVDQAIREAFLASHEGWSVDEVLLQDALRTNFLRSCGNQEALKECGYSESRLLSRLVQIRKAGKLDISARKRANTDLEAWYPVAEIASRQMVDKHGKNIDQWLVDTTALARFDAMALDIIPEADLYCVRKAAMQLRKSRKLQPELLSRVVDWKRSIVTMTVQEAEAELGGLPAQPGIYIFRDPTGYLYIGQSNNLRTRLSKHLDRSDRKSLNAYLQSKGGSEITLELHVFADDSPAKATVIREAYESELIRTRKPRFNVAP
jgi:predicted GIY-YIG superfamily endonuclease